LATPQQRAGTYGIRRVVARGFVANSGRIPIR